MSENAAGIRVACRRMGELTESDLAGWEALRAHHPHGHSPLLSPTFAKAVSRARSDLRAVVARKGKTVVACMAIHVRPFGFARPVGAPFDDLAGPLIAPGSGVTIRDLLSGSGLSAYSAHSTILQNGEVPENAAYTYVIDPQGVDSEAYIESRRKLHPKRFKNFRRLRNKLEREKGQVDFRWGRPDLASLDALLGWKREQFTREGLLDVTTATHSRAILDAVSTEAPNDPEAFGGFMVELRCNGELIAGHFGVREGAYFHPWISAYRPDFSEYAPGMVLLKRIVSSMSDMGLSSYQLADGHGHYKKYFATTGPPVAPVSVTAPGFMGTLHGAARRSWDLMGAAGSDTVGARLMRRMDHIAVCEPGQLARAKELAYAIVKRSRMENGEKVATI